METALLLLLFGGGLSFDGWLYDCRVLFDLGFISAGGRFSWRRFQGPKNTGLFLISGNYFYSLGGHPLPSLPAAPICRRQCTTEIVFELICGFLPVARGEKQERALPCPGRVSSRSFGSRSLRAHQRDGYSRHRLRFFENQSSSKPNTRNYTGSSV